MAGLWEATFMLLCKCVPSNVTTLAVIVVAAGIAAGAWYLYNRFLESRGIVRRDVTFVSGELSYNSRLCW